MWRRQMRRSRTESPGSAYVMRASRTESPGSAYVIRLKWMSRRYKKAAEFYSAMSECEEITRLDGVVEKLKSELKYVKACNEAYLSRCANQALKIQLLWEKVVSLHEEMGSLDDLAEFIMLYDE